MGNCCNKDIIKEPSPEVESYETASRKASQINFDLSNVNPLRDESFQSKRVEQNIVVAENIKKSIIEKPKSIIEESIYMINFKELKKCNSFPRYPDDSNLCTDIKEINREISLLIFVSHAWLRNWDGADDWDHKSHPDNSNNDKFQLMLVAIEQIKQLFAKHMTECYVWIDFSCINQDIESSKQLIRLDQIVQFCDLMLTPLVDNSWNEWDIVSTEAGWIKDYKAKSWNDGERSYINRSWCRLEMLYCLHMPPKEDINDRIYKCQSALAHAMLANRRPHFLFGTKENEEHRPPICLTGFDVDNPMKGFCTIKNDTKIIEDLLNKLNPYIAERSTFLQSGYIGEKNSDGQKHGHGKYIYKDGAVFSGEFKDDMRDTGILVTSSGEVYVGQFLNDFKNGTGKCTFTDGSLYEGEWLDDKKHGLGTFTYASGDKFVGNFENGIRNGHGTYYLKGEIAYEGTYLNNKRHGKGKYMWPDRLRNYEGDYKNDRMDGFGVLTYAEGVYTGEFQDNKRSGTGKYVFQNGDIHEGQYVNDKRHGEGKFLFKATGTIYEGAYKEGKRSGKGKYSWPDGRVYTGDFKDDKREGRGIYTWPNGSVYEGMFKDGKRNGSGKYVDVNGRIQNGRWKDDKFLN